MYHGREFADQGIMSVQVLLGSTPAPLYTLGGNIAYVEIVPDATFVLRVNNLTRRPIEIVCAVNRKNVLRPRQPAVLANMRGQVVAGLGVTNFVGWRVSANESEAKYDPFVFPHSSDPQDAGVIVIGFAAYRKQESSPTDCPPRDQDSDWLHQRPVATDATPELFNNWGHFATNRNGTIGTEYGHGTFATQPSRPVHFVRADAATPSSKINLVCETRAWLEQHDLLRPAPFVDDDPDDGCLAPLTGTYR